MYNIVLVEGVSLSYRRRLAAEGDQLQFRVSERGLYEFDVTGFTQPDIDVYDVSNPHIPFRIAGGSSYPCEGGGYGVNFAGKVGDSEKEYLAVSLPAVKNADAEPYSSPLLASAENQADYVFVTHAEFADALAPLAAHRRASGLTVRIVDVNDIYDEFNYGLMSPDAIRKFLQYTYGSWTGPAPAYVCLVGDGTYDYRDDEQWGARNLVPTYMYHSYLFGETGSDNAFVCLDDDPADQLADMFIGRLPVYTESQLATIVDKIIRYETGGADDEWTRRVTLAADNLDGGVYRQMNDGLADFLKADMQRTKLYLQDNLSNLAACRSGIVEAFNEGSLVISYMGHGSVQGWAHESLFGTGSVPALVNYEKLPFVVTMNCANGYFVYPAGVYNCLAEELMYASGGVIAIVAPGGISSVEVQEQMSRGIFESVFKDGNPEIGPALMKGQLRVMEKFGTGGENVINTFVLFGDPALRLKVP